MLGIADIAGYIPPQRVENAALKDKFGVDDAFLDEKIGVAAVSRLAPGETTSDMCVAAFAALNRKARVEASEVDAVVVVTQNPDSSIPHVSAILHGRLGLRADCACFDISLGCSGWVHALSITLAFMAANGRRRSLLFTADPYSKIIDPEDKSTALLFGDAATVTLLSDRPVFVPGRFSFGTAGTEHDALACRGGVLHMNGRAVFSFAATHVPRDVEAVLKLNALERDAIDRYVFHPGSRYIVTTIAKRLGLPPERVAFDPVREYGNTVSSSIPLLLEPELDCPGVRTVLVSGFGVGLAWASTVLTRTAT